MAALRHPRRIPDGASPARPGRGQDQDDDIIRSRKAVGPSGSLEPIGLEVDDEIEATGLDARRRRLQRIVVGAVAACGLILLAAAGAQVARAAGGRDVGAVAAAKAPEVAPPPPEPAAAPPLPVAAAPEPTKPPTTGSLHLLPPAALGQVWLDGEKVTTNDPVSCGKHEVRVGAKGHTHTIDVPCGGEVPISH